MHALLHLLWLLPLSLLTAFLANGNRRKRGYRVRSASITMRARGTTTPATVTTEGCSSPSTPGGQLEERYGLISPHRVSSCTGRGLSGGATDGRGVNGVLPVSAGFTNSTDAYFGPCTL